MSFDEPNPDAKERDLFSDVSGSFFHKLKF